VLAGALVAHLVGLLQAYQNMGSTADYVLMMKSAQAIWHGADVFRLPAIEAGRFTTSVLSNNYPPSFFLMAGPALWLPEPFRKLLWLVLVEELPLVLILAIVYSAIGRPTASELALTAAMTLLFFPVRESIFEGQLSILVIALAVAALWLSQRRRSFAGGVLLAVAIGIKLTPLLLVPYFVWRRDFRLCLGALVGLMVMLAGVVVAGWGRLLGGYVQLLLLHARGTAYVANQSFNGVVLRVCCPGLAGQPIPEPPTAARIVVLLASLLAVLLVLWTLRMNTLAGREERWVEYALLLVALPLLQPFAWFHHFAGAVLMIILGVRLARTRRLPALALTSLVCAYLALTFLASPLFDATRFTQVALLASNFPLRLVTSLGWAAIIVALIGFAAAMRQARARPAPA
jgi:alpha-1,2-mannosyltransferase